MPVLGLVLGTQSASTEGPQTCDNFQAFSKVAESNLSLFCKTCILGCILHRDRGERFFVSPGPSSP